MAEKIIVRQNNRFETTVYARDAHAPGHEDAPFQVVEQVQKLTPYGMMLAGLASCTAIVMHTYAQHRGIDLQEVEMRVSYDRVFADDCENCEHINRYEELIEDEIVLSGNLSEKERERLFAVSKQCPIHKILGHGIEIKSRLAET